jgi:hypothetical protein
MFKTHCQENSYRIMKRAGVHSYKYRIHSIETENYGWTQGGSDITRNSSLGMHHTEHLLFIPELLSLVLVAK